MTEDSGGLLVKCHKCGWIGTVLDCKIEDRVFSYSRGDGTYEGYVERIDLCPVCSSEDLEDES